MALTGRLSNTSYMGFQYSMENVVDHLTTTGITTIPGERRSIEELEGMSWHLKPTEQTSVRVPSRVAVNERLNRSNDEVTPGKVTILEERSDWDDDERSGGKLVLWKTLGRSEKLMRLTRDVLQKHILVFEAIADEPQNITSHVRQLILLEDPYRGSTDEQDRAYRDLDRITCEETKNLWSFLEDFRQLATKSGRLYFPSTTEKLFAKLPLFPYTKIIEEFIRTTFRGRNSGSYMPSSLLIFRLGMCKDAASQRIIEICALWFSISIPGYYKNNRKKYGMRKSRTYKGNKPHILISRCLSRSGTLMGTNRIFASADFDDSSVSAYQRKQNDEETRKLKGQLQKKEEEAEAQFSKEEFPPLGNKPCLETEVHYFRNATTKHEHQHVAILRKWHSKEALEPSNQTVFSSMSQLLKIHEKEVIPNMKVDKITHLQNRSLKSRHQPTKIAEEIVELEVSVRDIPRDK
ncbi:hypothetical protein Tco_0581433 [Tanacetum coccineum]